MLLNELIGIKQFKDLTIDQLISYFVEHSGYQKIGAGMTGTVFKHPTKPEIIKFWLQDDGYDIFMKYALAHQDNPYIVKVLQKPKTLTMFHSRPTKAKKPHTSIELEFPKKLNYTRLELLTPIDDDHLIYGMRADLLLIFCSNQSIMAAPAKTLDELREHLKSFHEYHIFHGKMSPNIDVESIQKFLLTVKDLIKFKPDVIIEDLHSGNIMLRGDLPVIIDPFSHLDSIEFTDTFNFYSRGHNIKDAIAMVNGREK